MKTWSHGNMVGWCISLYAEADLLVTSQAAWPKPQCVRSEILLIILSPSSLSSMCTARLCAGRPVKASGGGRGHGGARGSPTARGDSSPATSAASARWQRAGSGPGREGDLNPTGDPCDTVMSIREASAALSVPRDQLLLTDVVKGCEGGQLSDPCLTVCAQCLRALASWEGLHPLVRVQQDKREDKQSKHK